ncbi:MAG: alpha-L-rhamnosidase [Fimbriimonadaceae bacterium]
MPAIIDLRCEYLTEPLGLDEPHPRLSWRLASDEPGARQTAYRVIAGLEPGESNLWDSGRVEDRARPCVEYAGKPVSSVTRVWWQVTVWDQAGRELISAPASWETGLLDPADWKAKWIQGPLCGGPRTTVPAAYLSREFELAKPVVSARLYITALGLYESNLNGRKVGDHHLAPGWTDYRKRLRYQTFDVSADLVVGLNKLQVVLGDGWFCGHVGWRDRQFYGDRPKLLARLEVRHPDGSTSTAVTDESWKCGVGPILEADLLMGEAHDARRSVTDSWPVEIAQPEVGELTAPACPPIRKMRELPAVAVMENKQWPNSRWIFDFGQNVVGHVRLKVSAKRGQNFTLRHAEVLDKDGRLYTENLRGAKCVDYYTACGEGEEVWEPTFTFHGFRYVEISGFTDQPGLDAATAIVVHTDLPQIGSFECSDPLINQLQSNILSGWRGNSVDVPTDCPQRDERLGWTGDAQVFAPTACFNTFALTFFEKYMQDLEDSQAEDGAIPPIAPDIDINMPDGGPAWADAFVLVPMSVYRAYGDKRILERHYPAMVRWLAQQEATSRDGIRCYEEYEGFKGFGDWLNIDAETRKDLIGTAYFAQSAFAVSRAASYLGHTDDQARFVATAERVREAFRREFPREELKKTQTAMVLGLGHPFGFQLAEDRNALVNALVADIQNRGNHLSTGFIGAPCVLQALSSYAEYGVAYNLLEQKSWPSWLYPITKGATTIWERWDGWTEEKGFQDPGMNSFNHYAYGSVGDWLYTEVAGIMPGGTGDHRLLYRPRPGGTLTWAKASLVTPYGELKTCWRREGAAVTYELLVPPNTSVVIPAHIFGEVAEGEPGAKECGPGSHSISGRWPDDCPSADV